MPIWLLRASVFREGFIGVTVQPALSRFCRCDDGMFGCACVFAGVLVRRIIATTRASTLLARAQVNPPRVDLYAVFALPFFRMLNGNYSVDV